MAKLWLDENKQDIKVYGQKSELNYKLKDKLRNMDRSLKILTIKYLDKYIREKTERARLGRGKEGKAASCPEADGPSVCG